MTGRAALAFVALTALAMAMFPELNALIAAHPALAGWPPAGRFLALYAPYAIAIAVLGTHARLWSRLPRDAVWYVLLLSLAMAHVALPWIGGSLGQFALAAPMLKLALLAVPVAFLLRVTPRTGSLHEAGLVPGFQVFLALAILVALARPWGTDFPEQLASIQRKLPAVPRAAWDFLAAAVVVAAFILASGIRSRALQPCPARGLMQMGIVLFAVSAALPFMVVMAADAARLARLVAQAMLFAGAFYLLTHLLPRRAADELH
jgi:hypothetical protein